MFTGNVYIKKTKAPTYKSKLWFVVSDNLVTAFDKVEDITTLRIIKDEDKDKVDAYCFGKYDDPEFIAITIIFLTPYCLPGRIAHECLHALNLIYAFHGANRSRSNDEPECYYLDDLVEQAYGAINTYEKKVEQLAEKKIQKV
jgi:hypothetical protein